MVMQWISVGVVDGGQLNRPMASSSIAGTITRSFYSICTKSGNDSYCLLQLKKLKTDIRLFQLILPCAVTVRKVVLLSCNSLLKKSRLCFQTMVAAYNAVGARSRRPPTDTRTLLFGDRIAPPHAATSTSAIAASEVESLEQRNGGVVDTLRDRVGDMHHVRIALLPCLFSKYKHWRALSAYCYSFRFHASVLTPILLTSFHFS